MKDLGQILLTKTDTIIDKWIQAIREEVEIESAKGLAYKSVKDSIPLVVEALATLLSDSLKDKSQNIKDKGLEHGFVRAEQGYDAAEIVKEYGLLRQVIFCVLKPDLSKLTTEKALHASEIINSVLDEVVSFSVQSYVSAKLQELEQVQGQLVLTNQELTRLVSMEKENISYLAHELKNPLTAIMGFSKLLLKQNQKLTQGKDAALSLRFTEQVIENSKQLLSLINNALEMSRYEAGQIKLNLEETCVRSLIKTVIEAIEPSARFKNIEIIVDCDRAPELIISDPIRLQQIITNLVSNALRYTESGQIKISCQSDQKVWSLIVTDTGRGISPEEREQIFQPYYRAGSENNYVSGSTGLGLAIVAKLVELLQGEINLASQIGKGSIFTIILPLVIETAAEEP